MYVQLVKLIVRFIVKNMSKIHKIFAQIQRAKMAKCLINIDQVSVALAIVLGIENAHSTSES